MNRVNFIPPSPPLRHLDSYPRWQSTADGVKPQSRSFFGSQSFVCYWGRSHTQRPARSRLDRHTRFCVCSGQALFDIPRSPIQGQSSPCQRCVTATMPQTEYVATNARESCPRSRRSPTSRQDRDSVAMYAICPPPSSDLCGLVLPLDYPRRETCRLNLRTLPNEQWLFFSVRTEDALDGSSARGKTVAGGISCQAKLNVLIGITYPIMIAHYSETSRWGAPASPTDEDASCPTS